MAIPKFDEMLRPILEQATKKNITRKDSREFIAEFFRLSPEERVEKLPSGSTIVANRVGWAITFLTKAGLLERTAPKIYAITDAGQAFLLGHPKTITVANLKVIPGWEEAWKSNKQQKEPDKEDDLVESVTPLEAIDAAIEQLHADVKARLLDSILKQTPEFFEQLVLDVLVAMGYGGTRQGAARHMGKSGDEGIDGRINQDTLGLDQILVQAKRYAPDKPIARSAIQAFVGSLAGQGVSKGIFITTSHFVESAKEFVERGLNTKVVLIDGTTLVDLMMRHNVGVRAERTLVLVDIDQNYFEDDE